MRHPVEYRAIGFECVKGGVRYLVNCATTILIVLVIYGFLRGITGIGMDDSDSSSWNRSGLKIYTDYKTGVQYVSVGGELTVRIKPDGSPTFLEVKDPKENIQ